MKKSLGKNLCNSRKLKKVVVIKGSSKTNKQTSSFQKVNVFKNSEKVPYSKSSFYNQLIKYSLFLVSLWPMINTEERILTALSCVAVFELT